MKEYQNYLFDLDGTLITTTELIVNCFKYSLKKHLGIVPPESAIRNLIGLPLKEQINYYFTKKEFKVKQEQVDLVLLEKDHMEYQMKIWSDYVNAFPQVKEVLTQLKNKNKKLGIVTSRRIKTTTLFLQHLGLADFFDTIVTPEDTVNHKPDKEPIEFALSQIGGEVSETLYIGDSLYDMLAGQAAGVDQAFIEWETEEKIDLKNTAPTYKITHLSELIN